MTLDLSEQERQQLIELVQNAYQESNPEIHHAMGAGCSSYGKFRFISTPTA
jgi:hypothetical protein